MPGSNWRQRLKDAETAKGRPLTPEEREKVLIESFRESLRQIGGYDYVVETKVLRPVKDRTLYYLFYATRHERGMEVFRDCQVKALIAQAETRAAGKVQHAARSSGQSELFASLHDMGLRRSLRKTVGPSGTDAPPSIFSLVSTPLSQSAPPHHCSRA